MDTQRLVLFMLFVFSTFFLIEAWQKDQRPPAPVPAAAVPAPAAAPPTASASSANVPSPTPATQPVATPVTGGELQKGEQVRVQTDLVIATIDTAGGDVRLLELLAQRDTLDKKKNFTLLEVQPDHTYIAQSGLIGKDLPNHRTRYTTSDREVKLEEGANEATVRLVAPAANGVKVTKLFTFHRGSYVIDVSYEIENSSPSALQVDSYYQLVRDSKPPVGDSAMLPTFTGIAVYTDKEKFQKVTFAEVDKGKVPYPKRSNDGWIAMLQQIGRAHV